MKNQFTFFKNFPFRITALYLVFGFAWILLSDKLMNFMFKDIEDLSTAQTFKGILFILITALILFLFAKNHSKSINHARELLEKKILRQDLNLSKITFFQD